MTTSDHNTPDDRADLLSQIMFDENGSGSQIETTADLSLAEQTRIAKLQLLDSLLHTIYSSPRIKDSQSVNHQIQNVLQAIEFDSTHPQPAEDRWKSRRPIVSVLAITVTLMIAYLGISWRSNSSATAQEVVAKAQAAANELVDRMYRVSIRGGVITSRTTEAELYVRGNQRFAFKHPVPLGHFWLGSDGTNTWLVPAVGPVLVKHDTAWLQRWMANVEAESEFLRVATILDRLCDRYQLSELPQENLHGDGILFQHVRGERRPTTTLGPRTIDLWSNPKTGVAQRLVLTWASDDSPDSRASKSVQFDLQKDATIPTDVYTHSSHHTADRTVLKD